MLGVVARGFVFLCGVPSSTPMQWLTAMSWMPMPMRTLLMTALLKALELRCGRRL